MPNFCSETMVRVESKDPISILLEEAIATPTIVCNQSRSVSGCLYDKSGQIVEQSTRIGGIAGDHYISNNPRFLEYSCRTHNLAYLHGKSIYLGHYMAHYGHFIIETLSTFWSLLEETSFDYYVFHPFVFGSTLNSFSREIFDIFQIPIEKILILSDATQFESISIPERLTVLNFSTHNKMKDVYKKLVDSAVRNTAPSTKRFFYVSRVHNNIKKGNRSVLNEPIIEMFFMKNGFEIVYPERMTMKEQVSLFSSARVIVGVSGSGLHNSVFMGPRSTLVELADSRSPLETHPTQKICNSLSSAKYHFVAFEGAVLYKNLRIITVPIHCIRKAMNNIIWKSPIPKPPIPNMLFCYFKFLPNIYYLALLSALSIARVLKDRLSSFRKLETP